MRELTRFGVHSWAYLSAVLIMALLSSCGGGAHFSTHSGKVPSAVAAGALSQDVPAEGARRLPDASEVPDGTIWKNRYGQADSVRLKHKNGLPENSGISHAPGKLPATVHRFPLSFIPNRGQMDPEVKFYGRSRSAGFFFTATGVTYSFVPHEEESSPQKISMSSSVRNSGSLGGGKGRGHVVHLHFLGANPDPVMEGVEELAGKVNYFVGSDLSRWKRGLPMYRQVRYRELWPGIDLIYQGKGGELKYEFIVKPGADPSQIRLAYRGIEGMSVTDAGDLILRTSSGELRDGQPVAYQEIGGRRVTVKAGFRVERRGGAVDGAFTHGFEVHDYDPAHPLILDPGLEYSTFLGGGAEEYGAGIALDSSGNAYVTGTTYSFDFPTTAGALDRNLNGDSDAFVAKISADGSRLLYATFLGGSDVDWGRAIALDEAGNAVVTGSTVSSDFPTTLGAFDRSLNSDGDASNAFVVKLSADGSRLLYATFLGGSNEAMGTGIALDNSGNAVVTGWTDSSDFPTTTGAYDTTLNGNGKPFVAKLSADGSRLLYATFLGGSNEYGEDNGITGIALDSSGNAVVTGGTHSFDFPTTPGAYNTSFNGGYSDVFVAKLSADGSRLLYATFLGGSDQDWSRAIALDEAGNVHVTGGTGSTDFPTTAGAFDTNSINIHASEGFVAKLSADGSRLLYSTFLGGSEDDSGTGIALDSLGNAVVTGGTWSIDFPSTIGAYDTSFNGGESAAFVAKLSADGSRLLYATFLGGSNEYGEDNGITGIALDGAGNAYVTGSTRSSDFPTTPDSYNTVHNGSSDAFVAKLGLIALNGTISGRVIDSEGYPVGDMLVTAYHSCSEAQVKQARTEGEEGRYTLADLPPGQYKILFRDSSISIPYWKYYPGALDFASATSVTVRQGADTPNIDFQSTGAGSISGRVTDVAGNPISNLSVGVQAFDGTSSFGFGGRTDANGNYSIHALTPGKYVVFPSSFRTNWVRRYYGGGSEPSSATPVEVRPEEDASGIDFVLEQGGYISGRAMQASDGTPITNLVVLAYRVDMRSLQGVVNLGSARTNAEGFYTIQGLPAGDYLVWANTPGSRPEYAYQFYPRVSDALEATRVSVTTGAETSDINFSLGPGGAIAGKILDAEGQPISCGRAVSSNFEGYSSPTYSTTFFFPPVAALADSEGYYLIQGLPPLDQRVFAMPWGDQIDRFALRFYGDTSDFAQARPVAVTAKATTPDIDITLPRAGTISGLVTREDGSLLRDWPRMFVVELDTLRSPAFAFFASRTVWRSGRYILALPSGRYLVGAGGWSEGEERPFIRQLHWGVTQASQGTPVEVNEGQDTPEIDFALRLADGTLSGRVTDEGGKILRRPQIGALDNATGQEFSGAYLDLLGNYTLGLPAGSYRVFARSDWDLSHHVSEFFRDTPDIGRATLVPVATGANTPGIDFTLQGNAGAIEGKITHTGSGEPLPFVPLTAIDLATGMRFSDGSTDGSGHYWISVPAGRYRIEANSPDRPTYNPDYKTRYYPTPVEVAADQVTSDINLALGPRGVIGVTPSPFDFGSVQVGSSSAPRSFTLTNSGDGDLAVGAIVLMGADAAQFSLRNDTCSGRTVGASASCTFEALFSPASMGAKGAALAIPSNDPDHPMPNVALSGTGLNNAPVANDQLISMYEDTAKEVTLTATDANGDDLAYSIVTQPAHGTISGTPPNVRYVPNPDYFGDDSFTFRANDGIIDSNIATVSIAVAPAYAVSGFILDSNKTAVSGVTMETRDLQGTLVATALTDDRGEYRFNLPPINKYTLTPIKETHVFRPVSKKVTIKNKDVTGKQNFTCMELQIKGQVRDQRNKPLAGVTVNLKQGDAIVAPQAITDTKGNYAFSFYNAGIYIVEPVNNGSSFNPQNIEVVITTKNKTKVNFREAP